MLAEIRVILDGLPERLRAAIEDGRHAPGRARPLLTELEVAATARCRRERVRKAVLTGTLCPASEIADARGRTPKRLFSADLVRKWISIGRPTSPV